jgi:hypothetical protein
MKRLALTGQRHFENLMEMTSHHAPQCGLPYEILKITAGNVERFVSKQPDPGVVPAPESDET